MKKYKLKDHIVFELTNEWEQIDLKKKWNWITATIIHIYFEYEYFGYQFQFIFLGLGFYCRYNTNKSLKLFKKWEKEDKVDWEKILSSQEELDNFLKTKKVASRE